MNRGWQGFWLWCAAAIAGLAVGGASGSTPAEALRDLAGAPARLVWSRQPPPGDDPFVRGEGLTLMGLDTEDGVGERIILPGPDSFHRPMLTPRGDRVVFNRHAANEMWVVGFDGRGLRRLGSGLAVDVWLDEDEGLEWVYHIPGETGWGKGRPVMRLVLDDPERLEGVWDRTEVTVDNFQLSRDGRVASGQFPHPMGGLAELPDVGWTFFYRGCWSSLAPDNSYIMWVFDGAHRNLRFADPRTDERWNVPISVAPGVDGHEVYHPRWSNHRRLFVMTGPYTVTGHGANPIYGGGDQVDVHVGRFSEDLRAVEAWARVTAGGQADFAPDLWVLHDAHADGPVAADGRHPWRRDGKRVAADDPARPNASSPMPDEARPGVVRSHVTAEVLETTPTPTLAEIMPYRQALTVTLYRVVDGDDTLTAGDEILVAKWAVLDGEPIRTPPPAGASLELWIEPYDAHPQLESERLLMAMNRYELPLYVNVGNP